MVLCGAQRLFTLFLAPLSFPSYFPLSITSNKGERNPSGSASVRNRQHSPKKLLKKLLSVCRSSLGHPVRTSLRTLSGLHHDSRADLQHYAPVSAPSPRCCTPYGSLLWGRLGMVPPLPLNSVTAAFRAVYLSPVGASALGWLGAESHLMRDELRFALQRKKPSSTGSPCGSTFPFKG